MGKNKPSLLDLSRMRKEARANQSESIKEREIKETEASGQKEEESKVVKSKEEKETEGLKKKKVGRPKSLSSNPEYESTTVYINREIKAKARFHLAVNPEKKDLQSLINELLEDWVNQQKRKL